MINQEEDKTYTATCDMCGKQIKYCPNSNMAEECCYDDGWRIIKETYPDEYCINYNYRNKIINTFCKDCWNRIKELLLKDD